MKKIDLRDIAQETSLTNGTMKQTVQGIIVEAVLAASVEAVLADSVEAVFEASVESNECRKHNGNIQIIYDFLDL